MVDGFTARPDERCQRGLLVNYTLCRALDEDQLASALRAAFHDSLVEATEQWGARTVRRLVRQFCFEVRLGAAPGEIAFLHRALASAEQRAEQTRVFEECLRAALAREEKS